MNHTRIGVVCGVVLALAGSAGCGSKMSKMAQGLTPIAANFYVLHQDLDRARQTVKAEVSSAIDAHLPVYDSLSIQAQALTKDAAADIELAKKPALKAAIDSCLAADIPFIDIEARAIRLMAAGARLDIRIRDITQQSRGNSFKQRKAKAELASLSQERQQNRRQLEALLPGLAAAAGRCRAMLKQYNFIVGAEKVVTYFNAESIYDPFGWEQARPARHKPAAKPRAARKPAKSR